MTTNARPTSKKGPARFFTWRVNVYRLALGCIVLAVVLPLWATGYQPIWPIALLMLACALVIGVSLSRLPRVRDWLSR